MGGKCFRLGFTVFTASRFLVLVVIDDLDIVGVPITPFKANPELVVDPNAVLTLTITLQRLPPRPGNRRSSSEVAESRRASRMRAVFPID
jgi:hypothetical protein